MWLMDSLNESWAARGLGSELARVPRRGSGMSTETPTTSASRPASQGQGDVAVVEGKLNYLRLT